MRSWSVSTDVYALNIAVVGWLWEVQESVGGGGRCRNGCVVTRSKSLHCFCLGFACDLVGVLIYISSHDIHFHRSGIKYISGVCEL